MDDHHHKNLKKELNKIKLKTRKYFRRFSRDITVGESDERFENYTSWNEISNPFTVDISASTR